MVTGLGLIGMSPHTSHVASSISFPPVGSMPLRIGLPRLDAFVGNIESGHLHLLYGSEKSGLSDRLLYHLLVEAIREPGTSAVHILCGNYRSKCDAPDVELLLCLAKRAGLEPRDSLDRIHIVCAFTEEQQTEIIDHIVELLATNSRIGVVAVQQVGKLLSKPPLVSRERRDSLSDMIYRLVRLCAEVGVPIAASASPSTYGRPVPAPDGGAYLTQLAEVAIYLRAMKGGGATAYLLNHHEEAKIGGRLDLDEDELGRTRSTRTWEQARQPGNHYVALLRDNETKAFFDALWEVWSSEQGVMTYGYALSALDLLKLARMDKTRPVETPRVMKQDTQELLERLVARVIAQG